METRNKSLDKLYKRRARIDIPEYQRGKVWSLQKKQLFVDTILKGWKIPKLYFRLVDADEQSFECVDGQQRLNAVFEFYDNKLVLPDEAVKKYNGKTYSTLRPEFSDKFDDYEFQIDEIEDATDEELEVLFLRLQLGTPLNTAEKLNAIGGNLRDYIKELSKSDFFQKAISVRDTRYAHFVICSKFFYLVIHQIPSQLRQSELERMLKDNKNFSKKSPVASKVKKILDLLYNIFKNHPKVLRNRANILSVFYLLYQFKNIDSISKNIENIKDYFLSFFYLLQKEVEKGSKATNRNLLNYQDAISRNTDSKEAITTRNDILTKYLSIINPSLNVFIRRTHSQLNDSLQKEAKEIFNLIVEVNKSHLYNNGEEKIKLTSKNVKIEEKLGIPIHNETSFGELIDFIYKLLYEGSGNGIRLKNSNHDIINDIKYFRLDLRHDWGHGKTSDVKYKAKKISATYYKYTRKRSLNLLDRDDLTNLQLNIYKKIIDFLKQEI